MANLNRIKQFWIDKIKKLITDYQPNKGYFYYAQIKDNWENDINQQKDDVSDITDKATEICRTILNSRSGIFGGYSGWGLTKILDKLGSRAGEYIACIDKDVEDYVAELTRIKTELNNYKSTWDGHPTDYSAIKQERDNLKTTNTNLTQEKNNLTAERDRLKEQLGGKTNYDEIKRDIAKQIITDSGLDLDQNSNLEQLITKIKELIKKPGDTEKEKIISGLKEEKSQLQTQLTAKEQVIADLQKPQTEVMAELKQKIKSHWQKLGINNPAREKSLTEAQTYQQLVDLEQKTFATKWQENQTSLQAANKDKKNLKTGLIVSLLFLVIIILGGLVVMMKPKKTKIIEE